jgi:hypothetical protein
MHLIGGIMNIMAALAWSAAGILTGIFTFGIGLLYCCPAILLFPVAGLEIYSGIKHLSSDHAGLKEPKLVAIAEIVGFMGGGWISMIFGILTLVFLSEPEVSAYYQRKQLEG